MTLQKLERGLLYKYLKLAKFDLPEKRLKHESHNLAELFSKVCFRHRNWLMCFCKLPLSPQSTNPAALNCQDFSTGPQLHAFLTAFPAPTKEGSLENRKATKVTQVGHALKSCLSYSFVSQCPPCFFFRRRDFRSYF